MYEREIDVLKQNGIEIVRIRGEEAMARCCFHDDNNPSLSINLRREVYLCHACGAKGNFTKFGIENKREVYHDSFDSLLTEKEIEKQIFDVDSVKLNGRNFLNKRYWDYLMEREINNSVVKRFNIGYCSEGFYSDRIIIPFGIGFTARSVYTSRQGRLIYGRDFKKYLYPLGLQTSKILFNFDKDRKVLILVEGVFDVLRLASEGIEATAVLGCLLSDSQIEMLCASQAERVYLSFDGDIAGDCGMNDVAQVLGKYFNDIRIVYLPENIDPGNCDIKIFKKSLKEAKKPVWKWDWSL